VASAAERGVIADRFALANLVLGNIVGEFVGELFLNGFFLLAALVLSSRRPGLRWLLALSIVASAFGWIAMWRNVTPTVGPIAALNNAVLPLWMLALGVTLALCGRPWPKRELNEVS
jgi:hypothetical protein